MPCSHPFIFCIFGCICGLWLTGCDRAGVELPANAPVAQPQQPSDELGALPNQGDALAFHRRLSDEISNVDPAEENWTSEAFTEAANARMKDLAKVLLYPEQKSKTPDIASWINDDLKFGPLVSTDAPIAFESPAIAIRRETELSPEVAYPSQGREAFLASELPRLSKLFSGMEEQRAKFKIMHVELKEGKVLSRMLFEMRGRRPAAGWRQITAKWHCEWIRKESGPKLQAVRVTDYQEAKPGSGGRIEFADIAPSVLGKTDSYTRQLALSFDYWRARSDRSLVADLLGAQGVAVGDINGDHLDDLYVLQPGGLPNRLYLHEPDGTARDISGGSGVDILDFCRSALLLDLDNDGDQDLAIGLAWALAVFENDGAGQFTRKAKIASDGQINSMAAADYDNDGMIDIFVGGRDASGEIKSEQGALGIPMPYYDANNGGPNMLLRNEGAFAFTDVTKEVGMDVNNRRFSLACSWEDFDNDGDQDLYVSNDFGRNNLWRNDPGPDGGRVFVDIAEQTGVVDIGPGMSAAWGDHNHDGLMDLYVGNMWSNAGNRITLQQQFLPGADEATKKQARRHARGNSVYVNSGAGPFKDVTRFSGANMARWAWSSNFIDLNNDSYEDLVVANGMITAGDTGDL